MAWHRNRFWLFVMGIMVIGGVGALKAWLRRLYEIYVSRPRFCGWQYYTVGWQPDETWKRVEDEHGRAVYERLKM